jgi:hypothetical protein
MSELYDDVPEQSEQLDQIQEEDSLVDRGTDDVLDEGYSPPERYSTAERYGNTAEEQLAGETLDQRLSQEEPDEQPEDDDAEYLDDAEVGTARAGRLVDPAEGIGPDVDSELVGSDVGIDGAAASAEEAAVHVVADFEYDE